MKQEEATRLWKSENPDRVKLHHRKHDLKRRYGLSLEQYDQLLLGQKGRCLICNDEPKLKRLAVDHSHITGEIRGLLCSRCNLLVALLEQQPPIDLEIALRYLDISSQ